MRMWKWRGTVEETKEARTGSIEALDESSVREVFSGQFAYLEIEDQGPVFYYSLVEGVFQKVMKEKYLKAQSSQEASLKAYPSDEGRVWELYLPKVTSELLYSVHQLVEGESSGESSGNEVTIVGLPSELPGSHPP